MTIIERIQNLAKKTTGIDISGETIQEALENFEKEVDKKPEKATTRSYSKRSDSDGRKTYTQSKLDD